MAIGAQDLQVIFSVVVAIPVDVVNVHLVGIFGNKPTPHTLA